MKYSAIVLFVALAVFWSTAEARYNKYQDDVINAMNNWAIEEMRDLPEPHKTRLTNKLNDGKNRKWDNVGEYFKYVQQTMLDFVSELMRSKRSIQYDFARSNVVETLQRISNVVGSLDG